MPNLTSLERTYYLLDLLTSGMSDLDQISQIGVFSNFTFIKFTVIWCWIGKSLICHIWCQFNPFCVQIWKPRLTDCLCLLLFGHWLLEFSRPLREKKPNDLYLVGYLHRQRTLSWIIVVWCVHLNVNQKNGQNEIGFERLWYPLSILLLE